ncbi:MAG: TRAM domain-containing protein, partial [Anaeromyxobacteraceae bacterium]|nr:TRAM domain-containing protein [Anaeromyxobacteraceae bacterium]
DLLSFVEEQRFERLGVFEYSAEEGTPAAEMGGQVPAALKQERFRRIMEVQRDISHAHQQGMIGRTVEVLVEGRAEETEHLLAGRHAQQAPEIDGLTYVNDGVAYPGELVKVEITDASDYDLVGRVVARDPARPRAKLPAARRAPPPPRKRAGLNVIH